MPKINFKQRSLEQFGFYSKTTHKKVSAAPHVRDVAIGVAHRDSRGAHFDHQTLQLTTQVATAILRAPAMGMSPLRHHIKQLTVQPPFGIPEETTGEHGLLYIPGVARSIYESTDYQERKEFQTTLIKKALLEGRPILAVCGGCWQLFEEFGGETVEVKDHNYRAGMPRINANGKVGYNKQIHRITLQGHIVLGAMKLTRDDQPPVNSVHWRAPSSTMPPGLEISAQSLADPSLAPLTTYQEVSRSLDPEPCVEAFESQSGAPIVGVQWHPEAYTQNTPAEHLPENHCNLLKYMAEAGKTFLLRKQLVKEFHAAPVKLKRTLFRGEKLLNGSTHLFEQGLKAFHEKINQRNARRRTIRKLRKDGRESAHRTPGAPQTPRGYRFPVQSKSK